MIGPLRKRHRWTMLILAPITLVLFSLAVLSRNQVPTDNQWSRIDVEPLELKMISDLRVQGEEAAHFSASIHRGELGIYLALAANGIKKFPDVLVYQSSGALIDATLLGTYKGLKEYYKLSAEPQIIIYSLAQQRELVRIKLEDGS